MADAPTPPSTAPDERPWRLVDNRGHTIFEPKTENIGQGGRLAFLNIETWLDADGEHVWLAHDCKGERVVTMLPWPNWQVVVGDHVEPSFACDRCDSHSSVKLTRRIA